MAMPWQKYQTAQPQGPWSRYASGTPDEPWRGLDYDKPIEELRKDIGTLPAEHQKKARDIYAERQVARESAAGLKPSPFAAEGIPIVGGFLDEATAGIQSGLYSLSGGRIGDPYDEALALQRARSKAADEDAPILSFTSKLAAGAAAAPALPLPAPAATLAGRVGQGIAIGAPIGAVEGFSRGEGDLAGRLDAAGSGAVGGAALGGALPVAAAGGARLYGAAADLLSPGITRRLYGPEAAADDILARRIAAEGSTPAQKRLDLQQGHTTSRLNSNSQASLPETIADTSDAMQRLTGSVYRAGGEAGNEVKRVLQARQTGPANPYGPQPQGPPQGQRARILDTVRRALTIRTSGTARQTEQQIMAEQAREGRRLYAQAYESSEPFDLDRAIQGLALRIQQYPPPFAARLQRALNLFRRPGTKGNQPFWVDDVRRFDGAKKALDDMVEQAQRAGQGNLVRELTQFRNDLIDSVHAIDQAGNATRNLAYQEARNAWGSAAENREAIELGRSALRDGSEISVENFRALTPGQQQLFRVGFLESVRNALGTKKPGNDVLQLFEQARVQELLNDIIPRSRGTGVFANRPQRFGEIARRERRMVETRNSVLGNSATAQRQQDDLAFSGEAVSSLWNRFRSSPSLFNVGMEAIGHGLQRIFGYRQDVALALARRLLETDRTAQNQILRRLQQRGGPGRFEQFADELDRLSQRVNSGSLPTITDAQEQGR